MNFPDSIPQRMRLHDSAPTIGHFELAVFTAILALILASTALAAENTDPGDTGAQYAWSENTGWLNAEPGGNGGPGILVDDNTLTGYLWSESTGWVSLSCLNNNVCSAREYGVTNDGVGNLAGYAWSENLGWINFSCTSTGSCASGDYGVTIDPATGEFSGRAWNESTGWISFRNQPGATSYGVTTAWPAGEMCAPASDPDLNDDSVVNILDISQVGSCFGQDPTSVAQCAVADTNCDGSVDMIDINFVLGSFGQSGF
jgi:hypothetical protein